ncbi:GNAT family N-acetyltransferase [Halobacillus mangrovi]|uniref:GNAT family N-acetyltransferase n=2 Tax=Halobacillus mangrovi TaxID=402384 RepID=A0A1W5ZWW9_9BACI|nr:GNAT family N-acetyltransferase [Halobacillus mangrovi]
MMSPLSHPTIKKKTVLNPEEFIEVTELEKLCVEHEPVTLKLELDYKRGHLRTESEQNNEFLYYDEDLLIGYIGICQFGGEALEINGMVHPEYRRQGVFSELFSYVKEEWERRESLEMLLLNDSKSPAGQAFIQTQGAEYEHSEHDMYLTTVPGDMNTTGKLTLRKATNEDAKEIAAQNAIYFQMDETRLTLPEEEEKHGVEIYMAEREERSVGKVHLEISEDKGGIYGLGVLPEERRKGYGRAIIMDAVNKLREKQVNKIMLQVVVDNKNALLLYQSCGFTIASTMDYYKLRKRK